MGAHGYWGRVGREVGLVAQAAQGEAGLAVDGKAEGLVGGRVTEMEGDGGPEDVFVEGFGVG